jgi:hypothetical protein
MSVDQIQLSCPYGCGTLFTASRPAHIPSEQFCQAWKNDANGSGPHKFTCGTCGGEAVVHDDGSPASSDGNIDLANVSKPRIDALGATKSGSTAGGTEISLTGHAFDVATPTVKVNGVAATSVSVASATSLTCDTPAGTIGLIVAEYHMKLAHGTVTGGPFVVAETVTGGTSSATGVVTQVEAAYLMVKTVSGVFENGETITGGTSSASADLNADPASPAFSAGETITGQTSGSTATVQLAGTMRCDTFSGDMTDGEEILGGTSAARATLASSDCMDGFVTVSVENTNGSRGSHINHGTVSGGPFQRKETITGGTSNATAKIAYVGNGFLKVTDVSGQFTASETLTGGTSGATASYTSIYAGALVRAFEYTSS